MVIIVKSLLTSLYGSTHTLWSETNLYISLHRVPIPVGRGWFCESIFDMSRNCIGALSAKMGVLVRLFE